MSITRHYLSELVAEKDNGLKLYAQTAWGWSELKVGPFLRQAAKAREGLGDLVVMGFSEIRSDGSLTLKLPFKL